MDFTRSHPVNMNNSTTNHHANQQASPSISSALSPNHQQLYCKFSGKGKYQLKKYASLG
jgi:hypothetical protein